MTNLADDLVRLQSLPEVGGLARALAADQVVDFGQGEAEPLSLKNRLQARLVSGAVETGIAFPARLDEAAILIKSKGALAHAVEPRHLADRQLGSGVRCPRPGRRRLCWLNKRGTTSSS